MLPLADSAKQALLDVARRAVILAVERREILEDLPDDEALRQPGSAFVTLHRMGRLRGCVGQLASKERWFRWLPIARWQRRWMTRASLL